MNEASDSNTPLMAFMKLINGFRISQTMNVAARLGIADLLKDGSKSIDELARATHTDAQALYRVLRALASVNVFTEVAPYQFTLTPIADYLRSDNPESLRYYSMMNGEEWFWRTIGAMLPTVREGKPGISSVYPVNNYWEYAAQNSEAKSICNQAYSSIANNFHTPLITAYDFSSYSKVVDVGGGTGRLISSILKANPHLSGILFDLPETTTAGVEFLTAEGLINRCETVGGDIFKSVPSGGDIYVLSYVLADWKDNYCLTILENICSVLPENSKLLVIDSIIPADNEFHLSKWIDLSELCLGPGVIRTEVEYRTLFEKAGLQWIRTFSKETLVSIMELQRP